MHKNKVVLIVIGVMLLAIAVAIYTWPKQDSWYLTLQENDNPYDVNFFYELIEESNEVVKVENLDDFYDKSLNQKDTNSNLLKITYSLDLDSTEVEELLTYAANGNKAFIVTKYPPKLLLARLYYPAERMAALYRVKNLPDYWEWEDETLDYDSLHEASQVIERDLDRFFSTSSFNTIDTVAAVFNGLETNLHYKISEDNAYAYDYNYFTFSDSLNFRRQSLGEIDRYENFFKVRVGDGAIYFHSTPMAFTNYHLYRKETFNYCSAFVNEFNSGDVNIDVFNHYYRQDFNDSFRNSRNPNLPSSPLAFILSIAALKWAWYLILVGLLGFVIFRSKRNQRIIPVIAPVKNNSLEFSKTVGRLFYKERNHKRMAQEICQYFFNFLRKRYHISTKNFDDLAKSRLLKLFPKESRRINIIAHLSVKSFKKESEITQSELEDLYEATRYFILKSK
jgi:hypothetical protein